MFRATLRAMLRSGFFLAATVLFVLSCAPSRSAPVTGTRKTIVVSHSLLGSLVSDLVGEDAKVKVLVPNGLDMHEWEPSARDVEALTHADLIVVNGLGLEAGIAKALESAEGAGRPVFVAGDHVDIRTVGAGEGVPGGDPDQAVGAKDPHIWTDPLAMRDVILALAPAVKEKLGLDVDAKARRIATDLEALDAEIAAMVAGLPQDRRHIVTGHESLGYFARRYGFTLVGALVPGLSPDAETSASWLGALKALIARYKVPAIFTELGTSPQVAASLAKETGAKAIPLATHLLPPRPDAPGGTGNYADFERNLAATIIGGLK